MCCEWSESNDYHKFITQDTCVNFPISRLNRCEKNLDLDRVCCSIKKKEFGIKLRQQINKI